MSTAYRGSQDAARSLRPASQPFPATLEETWIGDAVYVSNSGQVMLPRFVKAAIGLSVFSAAPVIGLILVIALGETDGIVPMSILTAIVVPLCAWAWYASRRLVKVNALLNTGRLDDASRMLEGRTAVWGTAIGLLAQLQGRQEDAARAYRSVTTMLELPRSVPTPVTLQSYPREAIALVNIGQVHVASDRLARMGNAGEYCATLRMVAASYAAMAAGQPVCPAGAGEAARMADHFRKIRGSWGGLALAAFAFEQFGDHATCEALLAEERARAEFGRVQTFLPALFTWMERRQAAKAQ